MKRKSKYKSKRKNQKANPCKDSVKNLWYSVSVFWFKLCSRRLTERNAAILSSYNIYYEEGIYPYVVLWACGHRTWSIELYQEKKFWWYIVCDGGYSFFIKKSFFSFFTLTPSQMWLKRPVYRGFSGEGKCEGKCVSPHTLMDKSCICKRYRLRMLRMRLSNILPLIKQVPRTCKIRVIRAISVRKTY